MPETRPDKRFATYTALIIVGLIIAALVAAALCFTVVERHSTGLWIGVGLLIGALALGGIGYSAWIFRYYRCPAVPSPFAP